ncbi:pirin family protein [Pedobacter deserti]|uniref:pirin family protein n=1 Tax=Pedobacter deserti TaxID=2817382 RepID=UPI00210E04C1|nr:pirin family protein [Pedobacter sp. SYSU D00382]
MAQSILHLASTRDKSDFGWLKSAHTFSFGKHYNPERINFGALRVLNDDTVSGGMGFGEHPHDNMEIISIPLSGALKHEDSMGNIAIIEEGEIQVMSAGTGIYHKEFNKNHQETVQFLQIWLFPNQRNVTPRYQQLKYSERLTPNTFTQVLSPDANDEGVWIHQNAWFNIGKFDAETTVSYPLKNKDNGLYVFVINGSTIVEGQELHARDGYGVWETENISITASAGAEILLMEVPMNF